MCMLHNVSERFEVETHPAFAGAVHVDFAGFFADNGFGEYVKSDFVNVLKFYESSITIEDY